MAVAENVSAPNRAPLPVKLGLMLTALAILVSQIALTRVMSVIANYHFAFMILSVVMLGMASSAIAAFLGMKRTEHPVTISDGINAAYKSAMATLLTLFCFVVIVARDWGAGFQPFQLLFAAMLFFSWFFYSGYVVVVVLSHYASDVSRLYWFDLMGAAAGCLMVTPLLNRFNALSVLLLSAVCMAVSGLFLAQPHGNQRTRRNGWMLCGLLLLIWGVSVARPELVRLKFAKGQDQSQVLWERWNALARVSVTKEIPGTSEAVQMLQTKNGNQVTAEETEKLRRLWQAGWGVSRDFKGFVLPTLWLQLDSDAGTPILQNGVAALQDKSKLDFLSWDVTAAAYVWRAALGLPPERAFIIGGGGGRDVLTALAFNVGQVDVVELNPAVVEAVQQQFGNYSGLVYSHPQVHLTIGEARNELSHRTAIYDLIQMSMVDTWASSMAGSMVMTENSLYTQEAFDLYFSRLKPDGVLSVSRWYDPEKHGETARVAVLMASALRRAGIGRAEDHIAILTSPGFLHTAVATLLLKQSAFTENDKTALQQLCRGRGYSLLWPQLDREEKATSFDVAGLLRLDPQALAQSRYDLNPPTDDRPFFFNIDRPVQSWLDAVRSGDFSRGSRSMLLLGSILLLMCYACFYFTIKPLRTDWARNRAKATDGKSFLPLLLYFGGIGLGFMLVELALIQRYILFLGHPSYAISVVLFALLLFGGFGSFLTEKVSEAKLTWVIRLALSLILAGILLTAFVAPGWLERMAGWSWSARLVTAVLLIAPLALWMGMIYPLGVRRLTQMKQQDLVPWMWGINGICGVMASVLGMLMAMNVSYTAVLLAGAAAYGVTLLSLSLPENIAAKELPVYPISGKL